MNKIRKIEIDFPVAVELPNGFGKKLFDLIGKDICDLYEKQNPSKSLWPSGYGQKPMWREPLEPEFDESILHIQVSIKEK
ncbi:MAG: hypothetical protein ACE5R3_05415 [Nitrosopumilaceae archaeon]